LSKQATRALDELINGPDLSIHPLTGRIRMRILLVTQYFKPESIGSPIWIHELAVDVVSMGHHVTVLTGFPNYPGRIIFEGYRGKFFQREWLDGVEVIRTFIYASPNEAFWSRALNFGSFCASSGLGGLAARRPDVTYCIIPPMPLGLSAEFIGLIKHTPVVVNVQDIYPDIAISLGLLRNRMAIRFFQGMERFIYKHAAGVVVISDGFKDNLLRKGIPAKKIHVVPNWADPDFIRPGRKDNSFRRGLGVGDRFTLIYSGNLSHNSNVEPVIEAAWLLKNEPFAFVIVGDGVRKADLMREAEEKRLKNVYFLPFQSLEEYPQVLTAADMNLVTLNMQATMASVPSKVFKMMASGKPILAITAKGNEVHRLVTQAGCGLCVHPDDPVGLANALRYAASQRGDLEQMGTNGRRYLEEHFTRHKCVLQIEGVLKRAAKQ
jgi:colanic acid biosynthesis glycosyl transferase WcaI